MVILPSTMSQWKKLQDKGVSLELLKSACTAEAKEHHPNADKQMLVIQSLLERGNQLPPLAFGKGLRKLHGETNRRLQVCSTGSRKGGAG